MSLDIKTNIPFKDHPHFSHMVDILCRKNTHHVFLHVDFPKHFHRYLIEALVQHLTKEHSPINLREATIIYLDSITTNLATIKAELAGSDKLVIVIVPTGHANIEQQQFQALLQHARCRFIALIDTSAANPFDQLAAEFDLIHMPNPTNADIIGILKLQQSELEKFHDVVIPDELLEQAYAYAERYLTAKNPIEKALLLLDSSAARIANKDKNEQSKPFKSIVTLNTMSQVLSEWLHIPVTHLAPNKFRFNDFTGNLQQKIVGQDTAITLLGYAFQEAQARLQHRNGPFCSLLLAGPEHVGKNSLAIALAEQLFKQTGALYTAQKITASLPSLSQLKLQRHSDRVTLSLKEMIEQTPYAIINLDHFDQAPTTILDELHEILSTGFLSESNGNALNFSQAIIILNTTLGSHRLREFAKAHSEEEIVRDVDLLQLIMNEKTEAPANPNHFTPQELATEVAADIAALLPVSLIEYTNVIPFLPLKKVALEKLIRLKLKQLGKELDADHGLDLGYAPEVIAFLADEILNRDIEIGLKHLYFSIEQAILTQTDMQNRPTQLFLQLNETGQMLKCDWLVIDDRDQAAFDVKYHHV